MARNPRVDGYDEAIDPPPDDDRLLDWSLGLLEDAIERRRAHEGIWWENIATFVGDYWVKWDPHTRRLHEPPRSGDHKVRLPVNLAQPVVRTELAKLTKNKPIIDVIAKSNDKADLNAAEVGQKILNNYVEKKFHMPKVRRRALHWVLMCGFGGILVDYDDTASPKIEVLQNPEGEPVFDERMIEELSSYWKQKHQRPKTAGIQQGELVIKPVSPFQLVWDMSQLYLEDAWWVIYSDAMDVIEVERRWGVEVPGDDDVQPGVLEQRMLSKFDLTGKLSLEGSKVQRLAHVHRMWVKPGHPFFPNGLHLVFTKQEIIHKESFTFKHGELPISTMGHVPLPTSQYSLSVIQQVRPMVLELSRTVSQLIENRNLMANPGWTMPKQMKIPRDEIQNKPGMMLEYQAIPNLPPPAPIQMPDMPQYVKDLIPQMREIILEISGQGETSQGRVPPGARSGVAIAYLQEEDDTRLGPTVQEFEEMMERTASQTLEVIAEKYEMPRTFRINRGHSEPEVLDFIGTQLQGNTTTECQAGSALPRSKAAKQQYILDLWDRKIEQDPRRVRQWLELSEGEPDEYEKDLDQAERENRRLLAGEDVQAEEWHNHAAHHLVHQGLMKSAEFDEMAPEDQDRIRMHDEEHKLWEEQETLMQAAMQSAAGGNGGPPSQNGASPTGPGPEGEFPVGPGANGQQRPEGPPAPFASAPTPADLMGYMPQ